MYLFFFIILVVTGVLSAVDIFVGLKDVNEGVKLLVNLSNVLFFLSLLFFVFKSGTKREHKN
ncbi:hypothetical protein BT1A1_0037 [Caldibacillus thermoamylovorans]|jgi:choline-glycine betaine transporter|uniref:Uncharacterized protein n=1 Tax=Caldibacillus thermoamylovorans TaxID=35841 RepID=A0A090KMM0_9BACI|nr:hypothetical protein B4065_3585 [Caldibacillus thermoamylovorans]MDL0421334.1 hypothetical protein [Caldibacillus thermoamylovorans]PAC33783.1 hypothetical protein CEJ87_15905 [Caldifermentibacillus hisashii]CED99909.1 hypothetical protein BT1A1_0037 [Caldibacillus thermoamylovorans]